jgi:hypothetical protein
VNAVAVHRPIFSSFDRIAELMGVPSASFLDTHEDDVKNMKLTLLNYVKALRTQQSHPDLPFGIGNDQRQTSILLENTTDGYPILPIPLACHNWNKQQWEELFTMYMSRHYSKLYINTETN